MKTFVPRDILRNVFIRDGLVCQYCGTSAAVDYQIEHVVPRSRGGPHEMFNLVVACRACNLQKGIDVWVPTNLDRITQNHPDWRERILDWVYERPPLIPLPPVGPWGAIRYTGRAFRLQYGVKLRELARGTGLRPAALVALEHNKTHRIEQSHIARIVTWFRAQGITCEVGDLLVYEPADGRGGATHQ